MKKRKLNYRFHNPNTAEVTADYLLKILIEANASKVEQAIQEAADELPNDQNMMEGVLRSAWDAFYFFAIACVLSENQLKLVLESHRLVIEFSHRKF